MENAVFEVQSSAVTIFTSLSSTKLVEVLASLGNDIPMKVENDAPSIFATNCYVKEWSLLESKPSLDSPNARIVEKFAQALHFERLYRLKKVQNYCHGAIGDHQSVLQVTVRVHLFLIKS